MQVLTSRPTFKLAGLFIIFGLKCVGAESDFVQEIAFL